ncbi:MAG: serpin family protein, partial [Muribaculaceae bacterium]|nr:serpin family protein [Muribaculaceae bacterium]
VELAAVTGLTDSTAMPPTSVELNFNRPFYFFVREHSTQAILIAGHINNINSSSTI